MTTLTRWTCLLPLLAILALQGCATTPAPVIDDPALSRITDPRARRLLQQGKPEAAADVYSARAERTSDPLERQDYLLLAAEILFDRAMQAPAERKLAAIPEVLAAPELQQRRSILLARNALYNNDPDTALASLPVPEEVASAFHRARLFEVRAQAYRALNDPGNELAARIDLEAQLTRPDIIDKNHEQIWQLLTTQPLSTLRQMTTSVHGDTYQGWIQLALAHADAGSEAGRRAAGLQQWQALFPDHPANQRFLAALYEPNQFEGFSIAGNAIEQVAVLLPLSDARWSAVANAIRDGIVAAQLHYGREQAVPAVRFYDIGENPAYVRDVYQTAVSDGANAIIGPLRKEAVAAIVTQRHIPVPTITLNTVDSARRSGENLLQFGLAPEDEARSAASRAIALSLRNAVVLQSDDSRGDRETRAFHDMLYRYGGDVVHVAVLPADQYDYTREIKDALRITESDQRFRTLSRTIGEKLFFEPSIRDDVNVIFLAVSSEQARSVRPQLDFFHATAVPRLATSRVRNIENDEKANRDLNSIAYADAPWVLRKQLEKDPLRQSIIKHFPASDGVFARLYALGVDALRVVISLDALSQGERLPGYTGDLELTPDGRVQRIPDWAQYQEGESVGIERLEAPALQPIRAGGAPN